MKKLLLAISGFFAFYLVQAQQKQGKVVYQRTVQLNIQVQDEAMAQMIPKSRTDNFDLVFGNNQSLWTAQEEEMTPDAGGEGGMRFMMVRGGQNDVVFCDFNTTKRVEQREMFDKKFLIEDSIRKLPWKLTDETQTILDHVCRKATSQRTQTGMKMSMENGKMVRKEVTDTVPIVAWFTTDIPVSAGPELPGQLPGLILALDFNNGGTVYKATSISDKVDVAAIKAPTKGKKVTMDEFRAEQNKMIEEMQKNMQGSGNRVIIRN